MKKLTIVYLAVGLVVLALVGYFVIKARTRGLSSDGIYFSPASESIRRIQELGLSGSSEDRSSILDTNKLSIPEAIKSDLSEGSKANPEMDWVVELIPSNGDVFTKSEVSKLFDEQWRTKFSSTIYGLSATDGKWTFADAGDSPDRFTKLQVAVDLLEVYNDQNPQYDLQKLNRYLVELEKRFNVFRVKVKIEQKETLSATLTRVKKLDSFYREFNRGAVIVLRSTKPYQGSEAWDVLQSVGLNWGDGDLFHWDNNNGYGDKPYFSVWTSTEPGYFLPEEIRVGNMNPKDLIFGFSVPRSADPKHVFEAMIDAVKYCQKRLGGNILNENGQPFNPEKEKIEMEQFLKKMEAVGMKPGSSRALRMF